MDDLADRALREVNRKRRRELYWELQRSLLNGDNAAIPVGWVEGWFFRDKRVHNYRPGLTTYDNNTFMKVWLSQ